jgi:hypothetical protein
MAFYSNVYLAGEETKMQRADQEVLNPVAEQEASPKAEAAAERAAKSKAVIGLLNNSKPNVAFFLKAIEREILGQEQGYAIVNVVKARSAGPCPEIDLLAERCDYVINAVAD